MKKFVVLKENVLSLNSYKKTKRYDSKKYYIRLESKTLYHTLDEIKKSSKTYVLPDNIERVIIEGKLYDEDLNLISESINKRKALYITKKYKTYFIYRYELINNKLIAIKSDKEVNTSGNKYIVFNKQGNRVIRSLQELKNLLLVKDDTLDINDEIIDNIEEDIPKKNIDLIKDYIPEWAKKYVKSFDETKYDFTYEEYIKGELRIYKKGTHILEGGNNPAILNDDYISYWFEDMVHNNKGKAIINHYKTEHDSYALYDTILSEKSWKKKRRT